MKKFIFAAVFLILCLAIKSMNSSNADLVESKLDLSYESRTQARTVEPYRLSDSERRSFLIIKDSLMNESLKNDTIK